MKKALPFRVASIATTSLPKTRVRVFVASAGAGCVSVLICSFRLTWRLAASWRDRRAKGGAVGGEAAVRDRRERQRAHRPRRRRREGPYDAALAGVESLARAAGDRLGEEPGDEDRLVGVVLVSVVGDGYGRGVRADGHGVDDLPGGGVDDRHGSGRVVGDEEELLVGGDCAGPRLRADRDLGDQRS